MRSEFSLILILACVMQVPAITTVCAESRPALTIPVWNTTDRNKGKVVMTAMIPDDGKESHTAVIICPGGSYFWLDRQNEGVRMAECLCERGIAAFVLSYRTAGEFNFIFESRALYNGNTYPDMLDDVRQALSIVRNRSGEFGVGDGLTGVMGFSAGGHLAMLSAESCTDPRPDFVALVYPVVTMSDGSCVHHRSRRGLMGIRRGDAALRDSLSVEKHVEDDCCPVFLLCCRDDKVVNPKNSEILESALTSKGISHKFIYLPEGGHGFGCNAVGSGKNTFNWLDSFIDWILDFNCTGG